MKTLLKSVLPVLAVLAAGAVSVHAQTLDAAVQAKVDAQIKAIQAWASDPVLVKAVKAHNESLPADQAAMSQEKWKGLSVLDPVVRSFSKNEAGEFLKAKKTAAVSEMFLSGADGLKVAFLSKPSNWSHKGKAKHDVPMTGKTWQGTVEVDESTGQQQIQIAVPVLDGDKPIGSLIVGLSISKLEN
ncbi:MAG TPA: hypothetical protein VK327_16870 [Candidatus Paceibacterota bacterium]|nr:hypothetical protein [Candidatus Paceibacterota bacterium]